MLKPVVFSLAFVAAISLPFSANAAGECAKRGDCTSKQATARDRDKYGNMKAGGNTWTRKRDGGVYFSH
jgi:hypothetical protein